MAIPESQLDTWSHQGSIKQSSDTYAQIKGVLESPNSPFAKQNVSVFLQGSYGNDTNIYAESDVDIVIRHEGSMFYSVSDLPADQLPIFKAAFPGTATVGYPYRQFKGDVVSWLTKAYGSDVNPGDKAIAIKSNGSRRKADVIVATQYRRYHRYISEADQRYDLGICFHTSKGVRIANYPKQHSDNLTAKHRETSQWLKPMLRILKNMRSKLVEDKKLQAGVAPSYYLEGLLHNVPKEKFGGNYGDTFCECYNWINSADWTKFQCANGQYMLFHESSPVTWRTEQCVQFMAAAGQLWKNW